MCHKDETTRGTFCNINVPFYNVRSDKNDNIRNFINSNRISNGCFCSINMQRIINEKNELEKAIIVGAYFGIFQALMPIIGYFLGSTFEDLVTHIDHWIAFVLLVAIGGNMLKEAFANNSENCNDNVDFKTMSILAIATSIDALAVGITFAFLQANIWISARNYLDVLIEDVTLYKFKQIC